MIVNMFVIVLLVFCVQVMVDGRRCHIPGVFYCSCGSDGVDNYLTCDSFPISTETNVYTKQTVSISLLQSVRGNITYSTLMWPNLSELFDFDNNRFICYNGTCRNDQEFNIHVDVSQKTSPFGISPTSRYTRAFI